MAAPFGVSEGVRCVGLYAMVPQRALMPVAPSVYEGVLVAALVVTTGVTAYAWRRRAEPGGQFVVAYGGAAVLWSGAELATSLVAPFAWKALVFPTVIVGVSATVPAWFLFVLVYTGRWTLVSRRGIALASLLPALAAVLALTNPLHGLFFASLFPIETGAGIDLLPGPAFYLWAAYSIALLVASLVFLLDALPRVPRVYRRQIAFLVVGTVAPPVGSLARYAGVSSIDLTPVGIAVAGLALAAAISRTGFLDISPVAGDVVMDTIDGGVFVVDRGGRIVEANASAMALLGTDVDPVGQSMEAVLAPYPDARETYRSLLEEDVEEAELTFGDAHYRVTISPLVDYRDQVLGRVFLVTDVTERRRRQHELERQNQRLDEFASMVSHDLRSPLTVLDGRLEFARETGDEKHFEAAESAVDRMETIIDDVLALARDGQTVTEESRVPVSLATVAESAWASVPGEETTLELPENRRLEADPDRLQRALENLFRNSVEHGGAATDDGLTVRVGALPDGFYVEDDGQGIPAEEREAVLESGYSTAPDGTGIGLAIVGSIVDAHGWALSVDESASGGARVEVTGVRSIE